MENIVVDLVGGSGELDREREGQEKSKVKKKKEQHMLFIISSG